MIAGRKKTKCNEIIAQEWDKIAPLRLSQLENHCDLSMDFVLLPLLHEMTTDCDFSDVIDLGCGVGYTTRFFENKARSITGIDISSVSVDIAKRSSCNTISYFNTSIEDFSSVNSGRFTLAISNMTFMDVVDLERVIESTSRLLKNNSFLVITITHPCFWPFYWNYAKCDWFNYSEELEIEANFEISLQKTNVKTTHFHRPISFYIHTLMRYGFELVQLCEPSPETILKEKYPNSWEYPRFLGIKCRKFL